MKHTHNTSIEEKSRNRSQNDQILGGGVGGIRSNIPINGQDRRHDKHKTVAYKRNGFANGRGLTSVEDSTCNQSKFETKKFQRSYSVQEKEIHSDFNDDKFTSYLLFMSSKTIG